MISVANGLPFSQKIGYGQASFRPAFNAGSNFTQFVSQQVAKFLGTDIAGGMNLGYIDDAISADVNRSPAVDISTTDTTYADMGYAGNMERTQLFQNLAYMDTGNPDIPADELPGFSDLIAILETTPFDASYYM